MSFWGGVVRQHKSLQYQPPPYFVLTLTIATLSKPSPEVLSRKSSHPVCARLMVKTRRDDGAVEPLLLCTLERQCKQQRLDLMFGWEHASEFYVECPWTPTGQEFEVHLAGFVTAVEGADDPPAPTPSADMLALANGTLANVSDDSSYSPSITPPPRVEYDSDEMSRSSPSSHSGTSDGTGALLASRAPRQLRTKRPPPTASLLAAMQQQQQSQQQSQQQPPQQQQQEPRRRRKRRRVAAAPAPTSARSSEVRQSHPTTALATTEAGEVRRSHPTTALVATAEPDAVGGGGGRDDTRKRRTRASRASAAVAPAAAVATASPVTAASRKKARRKQRRRRQAAGSS